MDPYEMLVFLEDQARARDMVRDLESKGCRAWWASGMEEAIKVLSERAFDMVLTHAAISPGQRQDLIEKAKECNPDVIVVLMGTGGRKGDDHDTVSWGTESDVFTPAGQPEVWDRVAYYLNQTRLRKRVCRAAELIKRFQDEVSAIVTSLSMLVRDELSGVATEMKAVLDGQYGGMDSRASDRIGRLLEKVEGLTEVVESLQRGLLAGDRPRAGVRPGDRMAPEDKTARNK